MQSNQEYNLPEFKYKVIRSADEKQRERQRDREREHRQKHRQTDRAKEIIQVPQVMATAMEVEILITCWSYQQET